MQDIEYHESKYEVGFATSMIFGGKMAFFSRFCECTEIDFVVYSID
jgi:hypothetical protein